MAGRVLSFKQYLGGSDNVQVIEMLPQHQKTYTYDYGTDVSSYNFDANYSVVVLDTVAYDRVTGDPNFTETNVVGYLGNTSTTIGNANIVTTSAASGIINFTIPANRYTGWIYPDARANVVMTIVEFAWTDTTVTPNTTDSHRWGIIERYTADVVAGNPRSGSNTVTFVDITGA
jgi:hypothetical protein